MSDIPIYLQILFIALGFVPGAMVGMCLGAGMGMKAIAAQKAGTPHDTRYTVGTLVDLP